MREKQGGWSTPVRVNVAAAGYTVAPLMQVGVLCHARVPPLLSLARCRRVAPCLSYRYHLVLLLLAEVHAWA